MKRYNDFFGSYGGRFVAEMLRAPLDDLQEAFLEAAADPAFTHELEETLRDFAGRPTPLLRAENATRELGGAAIFIKLEGLAHTGAHKINNAVGQAMLARRMGKTRIIAETGAGQHGVATAAVCARLGIPCRVYMGEVDMRRQRPNVFWMERYGAEVVPVTTGSATLKDAVNEALRDWAASFPTTHYLLGSALGPSPYPDMVREFQSVIGRELVAQIREKGADVAALVACVGGGSNAIGFFSPYLETASPALIGVEAGGRGSGPGQHASRMNGRGRAGIVQGYKSLFV
jgi:tryptophan synthase beta chain